MTTTHPRPPCWGGNTPLAEVQKNDVVIVTLTRRYIAHYSVSSTFPFKHGTAF